MGKGRDKRKKNEDPAKSAARVAKQRTKLTKRSTIKKDDAEEPDRYNGEENLEVTLQRLKKQQVKVRGSMEQHDVPPPSPRVNSVLLKHPAKENELLLFGGERWDGVTSLIFDDMYIYNTVKRQWSKVVAAGVAPSPRSSVQGIVYNHYAIYHGGEYASRSQSQFIHFKDVWRFDAKTFLWEELKGLAKGPSSRSGHRMTLWRKNAVVFGGFYDNALETRYHNDLWILSNLDTTGKWYEVKFPEYGEVPLPRSGHCIGVHNDTVFVYGGYSTERASRFKKAEATVHHDLWCCDLQAYQRTHLDASAADSGSGVMFTWRRLKMGGIPPPIRSGVSGTVYGKRLLFFGGVVDIDAPGGKTVSSFHNDLFALHMDTQSFFPMVLRESKKGACGRKMDKGRAINDARKVPPLMNSKGTSDLAAELEALDIVRGDGCKGTMYEISSSDDDDEDTAADVAALLQRRSLSHKGNTTVTVEGPTCVDGAANPSNIASAASCGSPSYETLPSTGQILPHRRMDSAICVDGHQLYIWGGMFESGKREHTFGDLYSINMNRMDTYDVHLSMDMSKSYWKGAEDDDEDGAGSWESGSTVMSEDMMAGRDDSDDDEDDEYSDGEGRCGQPHPSLRGTSMASEMGDNGDDGMVCPRAVEVTLDDICSVAEGMTPAAGRTIIKGKKGMKLHKTQLQCQLSSDSGVPTPLNNKEELAVFYHRTEHFWLAMAAEALYGSDKKERTPSASEEHRDGTPSDPYSVLSPKQRKKCTREAVMYCTTRYDEAIALMEKLAVVAEQEVVEAAYFKERQNQRRAREREEEMAREEGDSEEMENNDD